MSDKSKFEELFAIDVNKNVKKKKNLSYLSWSWAWAEFKKANPAATYTIHKSEDGLPYVISHLGIMVYTSVTVDGLTHEMWLPVMDGANNAMKDIEYEVLTSKGKKQVKAATMFDVNKTVMRCLVKNLAMFGLGLYLYAGEDLPEESKIENERIEETGKKLNQIQSLYNNGQSEQITSIINEIDEEEKLLIWSKLSNEWKEVLKVYFIEDKNHAA